MRVRVGLLLPEIVQIKAHQLAHARRPAAAGAAMIALTLCAAPRAHAQAPSLPPLSFGVSDAIARLDVDEEAEQKQQKKKDKPSEPIAFKWRAHPSLRLWDDKIRLDFRLKLQFDWRGFDPDVETDDGTFRVRRKRVGIEGYVGKRIEFQIERELGDDFNPWRDVYVNVDFDRTFQVRGGKFKIPFSQEELTSETNLGFISRTISGEQLAPGRDVGVEARGRFFDRALGYQAGVFHHDGDNARSRSVPGADHTIALRLTSEPFDSRKGSIVKSIHFGGAVTFSDMPEGPYGLRGRTVESDYTFFERLYVHGQRLRTNAEFEWLPGPFSLRTEIIRVHESRDGQSIRNTDLSTAIDEGWYVAGTWVLTGGKQEDASEPKHPFPMHGFGAVEAALRYETIRFSSESQTGPAFSNPRADHVLPQSDRVWTFGVNWYLNRWVKLQGNGIHERIEDVRRTPVPGESSFWTGVLRLQIVL